MGWERCGRFGRVEMDGEPTVKVVQMKRECWGWFVKVFTDA
jgi:hypothetical protein